MLFEIKSDHLECSSSDPLEGMSLASFITNAIGTKDESSPSSLRLTADDSIFSDLDGFWAVKQVNNFHSMFNNPNSQQLLNL